MEPRLYSCTPVEQHTTTLTTSIATEHYILRSFCFFFSKNHYIRRVLGDIPITFAFSFRPVEALMWRVLFCHRWVCTLNQ